MMSKNPTSQCWSINAKEGDQRLVLFVESSEKSVATDLALPEQASLVRSGRHLNLSKTLTHVSDHFHFATGAFTAFATDRNLILEQDISVVDYIPEGISGHALGGHESSFLVTVYQKSQD